MTSIKCYKLLLKLKKISQLNFNIYQQGNKYFLKDNKGRFIYSIKDLTDIN